MSEYDPKFLSAGHANHENARKTYLKMVREKEAEVAGHATKAQPPDWWTTPRASAAETIADSVINEKEAEIAERAAKAPDLTCFVNQFPLAMAAVAAVHDYARGPPVKGNYLPSLLRHLFKHGEHPDHDAAVVWNALALLELRERAAREKPRNTSYDRPSGWRCPDHPAAAWITVNGERSCTECERKP